MLKSTPNPLLQPIRLAPASARAALTPLADRLRRELRGDVMFERAARGRYATDASIYQIMPIGVVVPRDQADLLLCLDIARSEKTPILARGGGTSQCGQTVAEALVIDNSKWLNKIVAFDPQQRPLSVPTLPGGGEKIQDQVQQLVNKINRLPLQDIAGHIAGNLVKLHKTLAQLNGRVLPEMNDTLRGVRQTLGAANGALAEDSPQRAELGDTLDQLQRAARSLRELSDYLSRHPESLLRGRPDNAPQAPR